MPNGAWERVLRGLGGGPSYLGPYYRKERFLEAVPVHAAGIDKLRNGQVDSGIWMAKSITVRIPINRSRVVPACTQ